MAKFSDYAQKRQDNLSDEIDEAAQNAQNREADNSGIPERFRGKSVEDVARSYEELEKAYSKQGNALGELRQTVDEFMKLQSEALKPKNPQEEAKPVTVDDLYEDADASIGRVVDKTVGSRIERLERELAQERYNNGLTVFDNNYKGWRDAVVSPEFREWVQGSSYRTRLAAEASQGLSLDSANALLEAWYDRGVVRNQVQEQNRARDLRNATLESASPESPYVEKPVSRAVVMKHRVAAKRGDPESIAWLQENAAVIAHAYNTGNITD